MIPLLRLHLRQVGDDLGFATVVGISALGAAFFAGLGAEAGTGLRAVGLTLAFSLGAYLRGRMSRPGGVAVAALGLPGLPVTQAERVGAIVLLGQAFLLAGSLLVLPLARFVAGPAAGLDTIGLLFHLAAWVPMLVAGAVFGPELSVGRLVGGLGLVLLGGWGGAGVAPLATAVWAVAATPFILRRTPRGPGASSRWRGLPRLPGRGWRWLLLRGVVGPLVGVGVVTGVLRLVAGADPDLRAAAGAVALIGLVPMPMFPTATVSGGLVAASPDAVFRLPVDRSTAVAVPLAGALLRVLLWSGLTAAVGWGDARSPALLAAALCGTAANTTIGGLGRGLVGIRGRLGAMFVSLVPVMTAVWTASTPARVAVDAAAVAVALGAAVRSAGPRSGRVLG